MVACSAFPGGFGLLACLVLAPCCALSAPERRTSTADDTSTALYSASVYAFTYGTPAATQVPLIVGFRTAALPGYSTTKQSKLRLTTTTGFDFSSFAIGDVLDVLNLPRITRWEASTTEVQLFFEQEPLQAAVDYELMVYTTTAASGTSVGAITVAWSGWSEASELWVEQEQGSRSVASSTIKSSTNSLSGSSLVSAWNSPTGTMVTVLVELRMDSLAYGVVSVSPFPPSAWDFGFQNDGMVDGAVCPSQEMEGTVSIHSPSSAAHCFVRQRGRSVNSIDLWFLAANLSRGESVKMVLPRPLAGVLQSWAISYMEWGDSPGYLFELLSLSDAALEVLGPQPQVAIDAFSSSYLGGSTLEISFLTGANMLASSYVDVWFDSQTFTIEPDGCEFGDQKPLGCQLATSTSTNACNVTWVNTNLQSFVWNATYSLRVRGTSAEAVSAAVVLRAVVVVHSGTDADGDGALDYWQAEGSYTIYPALPLGAVALHPTTVAASTKARVLLAFTTGTSTRFSGEAHEDFESGMVLRLFTNESTVLLMHRADGTNLESSVAESSEVDCSVWLLETWGESGFPHPSHCWWDGWSRLQPSIYMRFEPGNGLRSRTAYELVFLATLSESANGMTHLMQLEIRDSSTVLGYGSTGSSKTIVPQSVPGNSNQPIVESLEILDGEPLTGNNITFRFLGGTESGNYIAANNVVRLFLFPLTAWQLQSCSASRSDGAAVACAVEQVGGRANTVALTLDASSLPISTNGSSVIFTISGVPPPPDGFFRHELALEAYSNPQTAVYAASYISSAAGRLSSNNFVSSTITGGSGSIIFHEKDFVDDVNSSVLIVYRPPSTCRSTDDMPCQLVLTVPEGFLVQAVEISPNATTVRNHFAGIMPMPLSQSSQCTMKEQKCLFQVEAGTALWGGTKYGLSLNVSNPVLPLAQDAASNVWTVQLSGVDRWGFGQRQQTLSANLAGSFAVLGRLGSASVQLGSLTCGASTQLRLQFITVQAVPLGGSVLVVAPTGFDMRPESGGQCYTFEHMNWPGVSNCTAWASSVLLEPSTPLGAGVFYAFSMTAQLPLASMAPKEFSITTRSSGSMLDFAPRVSWSSQQTAAGDLVFSQIDCYARGVHRLMVSVDNMCPYAVTWAPANVTVEFQLGDFDITESPLGVNVYAPAGYSWHISSTGDGFTANPGTPLILSPQWLSSNRTYNPNELGLLLAAHLKGDESYTFVAQVLVPSKTPGTPELPASGNAWYVVFGDGVVGEQRWAAARAQVAQPQVHAIGSFSLARATAAAGATGALTVSFTTASALTSGGLVRLELPEGYAPGNHLGQACSSDPAWAQVSAAPALPKDMVLSCTAAAGATPAAFVWQAGSSGLSAGSYSFSVFMTNPSAAAAATMQHGSFVLRSFLDSAGTQVADMAASVLVSEVLQEMRQAELVLAHVHTQLFDAHPGMSTWVVLAFELRSSIEPQFTIRVRSPDGYEFPSICEVNIGDGNASVVLSDGLVVLAPHVIKRYIPFPSGTSATCEGHQREAHIAVAPSVPGSRSSFPAMPGQLYVFRVRVTNPVMTPLVNKWLLRVADQEYADIAGYSILEFRAVLVTPTNTAAGKEHTVQVHFWSRSSVPGRGNILGAIDHGIVLIEMPVGFQLRTDSEGYCLGYSMTNSSGALPEGVTCEGWTGDDTRVVLHNKMQGPVTPGQYDASFLVRNPAFPAEALEWKLTSYSHQSARDSALLDTGSVEGFRVNAQLLSFSTELWPEQRQESGVLATWRVGVVLTSEVRVGDALLLSAPQEYAFECAPGFVSVYLPAPECVGNHLLFSFQAESTTLPQLVPFGLDAVAPLVFQVHARNPAVKPVQNLLEFVHCRGAPLGSVPAAGTFGCPKGGHALASAQQQLWEIVPKLQAVQVELLTPRVTAQGRPSHFVLRFRAVSANAVSVKVECEGMDFTGSTAESGGVQLALSGSMGAVTVQMPAGQYVPTGELFELKVWRVTNPPPGQTRWEVTTYNQDGSVVDQATDHTGYTIHKYLEAQAAVECTPQLLLNPDIAESEKSGCTARAPWYEHEGNLVILRFTGLTGGEVMNGHQLLVQPPVGYSFASAGSDPLVVPVSGFAGADGDGLQHVLVAASSLQLGEAVGGLASQVLLVRLVSGLAMPGPFALGVRMNNPAQDPQTNLWRLMLLTPGGEPLYTNDGAWPGFSLRGTFHQTGTLTTLQWLVSDFPSESNVVRLQASLASPLTGKVLRMMLTAPEGFIFTSPCLPRDPDLRPVPVAPASGAAAVAWVTACTVDRTSRHIANLHLGTELEKHTIYAANLLVTNAATSKATSLWELHTFRNNDLFTFVHYTALQAFQLQVMDVAILPEVKKYSASSLLYVSLRPQRDLGPFGQVVISAPEGFGLFCRLRPFFARGNLPSGVACSGANNFAVVQLSGSDFLERGGQYQFAVRVTNPTQAAFAELGQSLPPWTVRLQTRERQLVQETTQAAGYAPAARSIARFAVAASSGTPGALTNVRVQFKLETALVRWRVNQLSFETPRGFGFQCAEELRRSSFVLPADVVQPAGLARFQELADTLELPPARNLETYRNEGTTEDGRTIVDCSESGRLSMAVDSTDMVSLGRYAFTVSVRNAAELPVPNVWMLHSYSEGVLQEEGATGGYELQSVVVDSQDQDAAGSASNAYRACGFLGHFVLVYLLFA